MSSALSDALLSIQIESKSWRFADFRIDIPAESYGSDAINPHTQYSNPIALFDHKTGTGVGACFTLGEGNHMICDAAEYIVRQLDGLTISDLTNQGKGFYETLTNPLQLRWLSPNSGVPMMAAGLVANTLIDAAAKTCQMPAWEYLAKLPSDFLLSMLENRHLTNEFSRHAMMDILEQGLSGVEERCQKLRRFGLPVYYTTWIGHDAETIAKQIHREYSERGIKQFKIKIGPSVERDVQKIQTILKLIPNNVVICVDANQTLNLSEAIRWMDSLSDMNILWLEEPFAPDNTELFRALINAKTKHDWKTEIVTGENCPNHYTAATLMKCGIDRFQADPCRMLGLIDAMLTCVLARIAGCTITPHAGGSSLDEQSPHIQLFNLARVRTELPASESLTENVGFCSRFFAAPTVVKEGYARTPDTPGLLVGLEPTLQSSLRNYRDGITWLKL